MFIVQVSSNTEVFESIELYLEDDLEMAGCFAVALERDSL